MSARRPVSARGAAALAALLLMCSILRVDAQVVQQPIPAPNSVFLEVGGPGGFYSTNYDYLLNEVVSVRGGATSWSITSFDKQTEKMDAGILGAAARYDISRYVDRDEGRYVEAGATITAGKYLRASYGVDKAEGWFTTLVPMFGIRYQPRGGGFMYRATFTPFIPISGGAAQYPTGGAQKAASLSVGYTF